MIPLVVVALVSLAVLAFEVLLIRLLAITQWHHLAFMVISIALLGFGASGTFLALTQRVLVRRFHAALAINAAALGICVIASFALAQRVPFNALAILWDPRQYLYLLVLCLLFTVPFFFGANCIALAFLRYGAQIGRVYAANLLGSGIGALCVVGALFVLTPPEVLRVIAGVAVAAAALACVDVPTARWRLAAVGLALLAVAWPLGAPEVWTALRVSEFKGLSQALTVPGARVIGRYGSPLGDLAVVESPRVPFRHAPGLSLAAVGEPPPQLGVFTDADGFTAITAFDGRLPPLAYLDFTTSALPYHLLDRPEVLVLGAGGGGDVLQALYHEAARVDAVELDPLMVQLVREVHGDFAGGLYDLPGVRVHVGEARGFVARADRQWDLIQIPLLDSFAAAAAGVHGLSESFVYTVEAMQRYLRRLRPGGYLAITRWLKLPPRDSLKLFATALDALAQEDVADPAARLALVRSWNTTTLLVKNGAIAPADIEIMRAFASERSFDLAFYPGMPASEANRTNVLDAPYFHAGATALAGAGRADFVARYKFDIRPATDDRPYFFDFFRWRTQFELLGSPTVGVASLLEWSYPILVATLVQVLALSVVLILLPLALRQRGDAHPDRWRIAAFFVATGIAFLFVEIAFIQRFVLFLHNPLFAVAVVIAGFLVFAGLGSACAPAFAARLERTRAHVGRARVSALEIAVGAIGLIALTYLAVLPPLFDAFIALSQPVKVALSLLCIAPLGFWMGMPFPLVLADVKARAPDLVPWAWAVSGCASVLSVVLATLLAMQFGFVAVVSLAIVAYALAALLMRAPLHHGLKRGELP